MSREMVLNIAGQMPPNFRLEDLVERLVLLEKIDDAQQSIDAGKGVPHGEAVDQIRAAMNNLQNGGGNLVT